MTLCDFDRVELSNLARQVLYRPGDVARPKVEVAGERLAALNPDVDVSLMTGRVDDAVARNLFRRHDLLIDASDNYGTRLAVNRAALAVGVPWIMGSCVRMEGQLALFRPGAGRPCYRCAYGAAPDSLEDCPGAGILAPVAGVIGSAMALMALKHLAGLDPDDALHVFDGSAFQWRRLDIRRRPDCPACSDGADR